MAQYANAVQLRQVEIEDDYVILRLSRGGSSLFAVRENIDRVVFAFQTLANESGQRFIIFRNKNSHNVNRP